MSAEKEMSFWGHIGELRGHLIRSLIAIIIGAIIVGFNIEWVMTHLFFGPTHPNFITFEVLNDLTKHAFGEESFKMKGNFAVQQKKLLEQFDIAVKVSIFGGLVLAFPYVIMELWRFISPALRPHERKNSIFYINFIWLLFFLGILVGYFLILPLAINFGLMFSISDRITQLFDLSDYTALFLQVVLGMGVVFLFPVVVYVLTSIGILTPIFLKTYRRHAIVLIMIVAAVITPADAFSMMAAALPLLLLYEFSVLLSLNVYKRVQREANQVLSNRN